MDPRHSSYVVLEVNYNQLITRIFTSYFAIKFCIAQCKSKGHSFSHFVIFYA